VNRLTLLLAAVLVAGQWSTLLSSGAEATKPQLALVARATIPDDNQSFTFRDLPIGDPAYDRRLIVAVHWGAAHDEDSQLQLATIAGQPADIVGQVQNNFANRNSAFITAIVPPGETTVVALEFDRGNVSRCSIAVWRAGRLVNLAPTSVVTATGHSPLALSLPVEDGGIVIAAASMHVSAASSSEWAGGEERYDEQLESTAQFISGIDATGLAASEDYRLVNTFISPSADEDSSMIAVSWR
jgi:hypothetical protein